MKPTGGDVDKFIAEATGAGCLSIKNLDEVDMSVLEDVITASFRTVRDRAFGAPAGDGGAPS